MPSSFMAWAMFLFFAGGAAGGWFVVFHVAMSQIERRKAGK